MEKEHYENIIALLKQTLEFYGDENTYTQSESEKESIIKIFKDKGEYARNILKIINDLEKSNKSFENDYEKYVNNEQTDLNVNDQTNKILNKLKNLNKWK